MCVLSIVIPESRGLVESEHSANLATGFFTTIARPGLQDSN